MSKRVAIGGRPTAIRSAVEDADAWVEHRAAEPAPAEPQMKRLTIDIPADLHRSIKSQCALRGTKIADEVRELLTQKFGKT